MRIELARHEHLALIPAIEVAAASLFSETDLPEHIRCSVTDPGTLRYARNNSRLWVALGDADQPVGFAMADVVDGHAHLDEMDVLPDYGRRGIGTRLVKTVKEWACLSGFYALTLVTFRHLPWNAPFYEKLGFVRLNWAELGDGLAGLIEEEAEVGIDIRNRIGMKLRLEHQFENRGGSQ